jgi:hypothetical protein
MSEFDRLVASLSRFPSQKWINRYFDLLKKLLTEFSIENDDPRLALSLNKNLEMPVNFGQRYVLRPYIYNYIGIIVPVHFEEAAVDGEMVYKFTKNKIAEAKYIELPFYASSVLDPALYNACVVACSDILRSAKKSGFRKFHSALLYDFTMEPAVRNEVLMKVTTER